MPAAVLLRIGANVFSSIYTMLANKLGDKLVQQSTSVKKEKESIKNVPDGTRKKSVTG